MKTLSPTLFLIVLIFSLLPAKAAQTGTPQAKSADQCAPPTVVAALLNLSEAQTAQFATLLDQFQPTLQGLFEQITVLQTQLDVWLSQPNPNPAVIGNLLLQIHALQQQLAQAIQNYQTLFASLLTDAQKQRVQAVTQASQLQPVVGAFVALKLAPVPTPLPCQQQ